MAEVPLSPSLARCLAGFDVCCIIDEAGCYLRSPLICSSP